MRHAEYAGMDNSGSTAISAFSDFPKYCKFGLSYVGYNERWEQYAYVRLVHMPHCLHTDMSGTLELSGF